METGMSHEAMAAEVFGGPDHKTEPTVMADSNVAMVREVFGMDPETPAQPQPQGQRQGGQDQPAGEGPATDTDLAAVELPQDIKAVAHLPEVAAELSTFRKDARDLGLTKKQAAGVLQKFTEHNVRQEAVARSAGVREMQGAWGQNYEAEVARTRGMIRELEGQVPGLRRLAQGPAGNSLAFARLVQLAHGNFNNR